MSDNNIAPTTASLEPDNELSVTQLFTQKPELKEMMLRDNPTSYEGFVKQLYKDLDTVIYNLEGARKHHQESGEDAITSNIITQLKMHYKSVFPEIEDGGHCDIYVEHTSFGRTPYKWIGEAKVWKGAEYGLKGMTQLLNSYASGTATAKQGGILFYFITQPTSPAIFMKEWVSSLNTQYVDDSCIKIDELGLRYQSCHKVNSGLGLNFTVNHFAVSLYHKPTQQVIATREAKKESIMREKILQELKAAKKT